MTAGTESTWTRLARSAPGPWLLLWLGLSLLGLILITLIPFPEGLDWTEEYGWTGRVEVPRLRTDSMAGQAIRPEGPVNKLSLLYATYGRPVEGELEVLLLKGLAPPASNGEIQRRAFYREKIDAAKIFDGAFLSIRLENWDYSWRSGFYLLVRGKRSAENVPIALWSDQDPDWPGPKADFLYPSGIGDGLVAKPLTGHLSLGLAFEGTASLWSGLRVQHLTWALALIPGVFLMAGLIVVAALAGRRLGRPLPLSPPDRPSGVWLVLILLLTLALDLIFYTGFYGGDDTSYLAGAFHLSRFSSGLDFKDGWIFLQDGVRAFDYGGLRFILTLPSALIHYLSSGSLFAICLYFISYHLGLVILTHATGRLISGQLCGLTSALLVAVSPLAFVFAGALLPDLGLGFWSLASIHLLLRLNREQAAAKEPVPLGRKGTLLLGAGLCLGMAYSAKMPGLIMILPCVLGAILVSRRIWSRESLVNLVLLGSGLAGYLVVETGLLYLLFEEPVLRIQVFSGQSWPGAHPDLTPADAPSFMARAAEKFLLPPLSSFSDHYLEICGFYPMAAVWLILGSLAIHPFLKGANPILWTAAVWPILYVVMGPTSIWLMGALSVEARYHTLAVGPAALIPAQTLLGLLGLLAARLGGGARVRFLLQAGLLSLLIILGATGVIKNLSRAGDIYDAWMLRGYREVLARAQAVHPGLPLVLGRLFSSRLGPLFLERRPEGLLVQEVEGGKPLQLEPPFLVMAPVDSFDRPEELERLVKPPWQDSLSFRLVELLPAPPGSGLWKRMGLDLGSQKQKEDPSTAWNDPGKTIALVAVEGGDGESLAKGPLRSTKGGQVKDV